VPRHPVMADSPGLTGTRRIAAIVGGARAPNPWATRRAGPCQQAAATMARAWHGHGRAEHLCALPQASALALFSRQPMAHLATRLAASRHTCEEHPEGHPLAPWPRQRPPTPTAPPCDTTNVLSRMTGVALPTSEGMGGHLALGSIAAIGTARRPWASENPLASWLCLAPGHPTRGGKHKRRQTGTRPRAKRAKQLWRRAAMARSRADRARGACYRRLRGRLGAPKASTATAPKRAKSVDNRLTQGQASGERGAQYDDQP
jgi:transposase